MSRLLVSGLINIEVTLKVDSFPIPYSPVRYPFFGINSTVSGVGYNVARALTTLGDSVRFLSIIGTDFAGQVVLETCRTQGIAADLIQPMLTETAHSVIMFDDEGQRAINVDLKNIQESVYPAPLVDTALAECDIAALCNINFSRPMLAKAKKAGKLIASDVHTVARLDDDYNRDFMQYADILFMSDAKLPCPPEEWANAVMGRYAPKILVIGLGAQGALLAVRDEGLITRFPAVSTRPVVNTIGAGDALFSGFLHYYAASKNPTLALQKATIFASYKIGANGGADGFLNEAALETLKITP